MHLKLLRAAARIAVFGGIVTLGLGSTQAALASPTIVPVTCSSSTLAGDMTSPLNDTVLILAPDCIYTLTAALTTVTNEVTIVGHKSTSIVRGYSAGPFSIFAVGTDGDLILDGVNVRNGGGDDDGGAIYMDPGTVTIHGGIFSDNNTIDGGGAIYNYHGILTVDGATFTHNSSEDGGAIYSQGTVTSATLDGDTFSHNYASEEGGAIYNEDNDMTIAGGNFRYDSAPYGGAIYNDYDVTIAHTQIAMNSASDEGGGIYNDDETVTIDGSLIITNWATDGGGGIYNYDGGTVTLVGNLINMNAPDNCDPTGTITGCTG